MIFFPARGVPIIGSVADEKGRQVEMDLHRLRQHLLELLLSERVNREKKAKGERLRWHIAERPQKPFIDSEWVSQVMTDLQDAELDYLVGAKTTLGHWFTVRPQLWQAGLVHALIYKPSIGFSAGGDMRKPASRWRANLQS